MTHDDDRFWKAERLRTAEIHLIETARRGRNCDIAAERVRNAYRTWLSACVRDGLASSTHPDLGEAE